MVQSHILFEIRRMGSPAMQQVSEELGMDITTFSRQVKSLEKKRLVARQVSAEDRRVNLLGLTVDGSAVLEKIDRYMADRLGRIFSRMSAFEQETVTRSLELLNDAVAKAAEAGSGQEGKIACCK
jgi:DNA-binding MarR family transcriptional regulator